MDACARCVVCFIKPDRMTQILKPLKLGTWLSTYESRYTSGEYILQYMFWVCHVLRELPLEKPGVDEEAKQRGYKGGSK